MPPVSDPASSCLTAVILTALAVETSAVLRHLSNVRTETVSGTGFFRGGFDGWDIAVAEVGAGNAGAAAIAVRACERYRPKVALFVGVAGGVKDVAIGDVVVATKVYGYESGRDEETQFKSRPATHLSAHALEQRARIIRQIEDWKARLDPALGHDDPSVFVGPIAAGEKVVASTKARTAQLILEHYGDTLAVEMEGRGFLEGVHISHQVDGCVVRGISDLLSGKAAADQGGSQERAADAAAAVAYQMLSGLGSPQPGPKANTPPVSAAEGPTLNVSDLKMMASALLESGVPPSVNMLFPAAPEPARLALKASATMERTLVEPNASSKDTNRFPIDALAARGEKKHLILGPPGSGKSHALWNAADRLLKKEDIIPLFIPLGQLNTWDQVVSIIHDAAPKLTLEDILRDPRVCLLIDGWSEFARGEYIGERQKALRALRDTRVIANGKFADVSDTPFKSWSLELLSPREVQDTLFAARPGEAILSGPVLDLLRLPLLLSIHILSDVTASATGDLLRQLHDHLARDLPEAFTAALTEAVADSSLAGDRSYGRLISNLQSRAISKGVVEPVQLLRRLGTITVRNGQALPIHDLGNRTGLKIRD